MNRRAVSRAGRLAGGMPDWAFTYTSNERGLNRHGWWPRGKFERRAPRAGPAFRRAGSATTRRPTVDAADKGANDLPRRSRGSDKIPLQLNSGVRRRHASPTFHLATHRLSGGPVALANEVVESPR